MIRRLFWLSLGAVVGIAGYRRAETMAWAASGRVADATEPQLGHATAPGAAADRRAAAADRRARSGRSTVAWIKATIRFARHVREGVELYLDPRADQAEQAGQHRAGPGERAAGPRLELHGMTAGRANGHEGDARDGR